MEQVPGWVWSLLCVYIFWYTAMGVTLYLSWIEPQKRKNMRLEGANEDHNQVQTLVQSRSNFKVGSCSQGFAQLCFKNLQTRDPTASQGSLLPALRVTIISLCPTKIFLAATCVYSFLSFHCVLLVGSGSICSIALSLGSVTLISAPSQPSPG